MNGVRFIGYPVAYYCRVVDGQMAFCTLARRAFYGAREDESGIKP